MSQSNEVKLYYSHQHLEQAAQDFIARYELSQTSLPAVMEALDKAIVSKLEEELTSLLTEVNHPSNFRYMSDLEKFSKSQFVYAADEVHDDIAIAA